MRGFLSATALVLLSAPATAGTPEGFLTSGGVGQINCAVYTNAVAEARQMGGLASLDGITHVNPFVQYAYGFYTGYNALADNVFDVLDSIRGEQMHVTIVTMADTYCQKNPTGNFDDALIDSIYTLLPKAANQKPAGN